MKNPKFIHTQFLEDISLCDDMITFFNNNPKLQRKGIANTKRIPRGSTKFKGKISTDKGTMMVDFYYKEKLL